MKALARLAALALPWGMLLLAGFEASRDAGASATARAHPRSGVVIARERVGEGSAELLASRSPHSRRICLTLNRRADARAVGVSWRTCGVRSPRTERLLLRKRIACRLHEIQVVGAVPASVTRLRFDLDDGHTAARRAYSPARELHFRAKLTFGVFRRGDPGRVRAYDSNGVLVATARLPLVRGFPCPR